MIPKIKSADPYLEAAGADLPIYSKPHVYHTDCTCGERFPARTMIDGRWVIVCMRCGSLRQGTGT